MQQNVLQKTVSFPLVVVDCTLPRVISVQPARVPNVMSIAGRTLLLRTSVSVICANFQPQLSDVYVMVGSETAAVTNVKVLATCLQGDLDCSRTQIVFRSPALESPGHKIVQISSSLLQTPLTLTVEYTPPCDFVLFCQKYALVFDYKKMLSNPTLTCSAEYCLNPTNIGDPVLTSFSPSSGLTSGGTMIKVNISDLPVFFVEDLSATVAFGTSSTFADIVSLVQDDDSTLVNGAAYVVVRAPLVSADAQVVTITISAMVYGMGKKVMFPFEYLPVIQGPAAVVEYLPHQVYRTQDLDLYVKVQNVPMINQPFNVSKMLVKIGAGHAVPASTIVSSDRAATALRLRVSAPSTSWSESNTLTIRIIHVDRGLENAANFSVAIMEEPSPEVVSFYPMTGSASDKNMVRLVLAHLPVDAVKNDVTASMTFQRTGTRSNATVLGTGIMYNGTMSRMKKLFAECDPAGPLKPCCSRAYCSLFEVAIELLPLSEDESALGGPADIILVVVGEIALVFPFQFLAAGEPKMQAVNPSAQGLLVAGMPGHEISLYIKNFPSLSCKKNATCAGEVSLASLAIHFGANAGAVVSMSDVSGMLHIKVLAASSCTGGKVRGRMSGLDSSASMVVLYFDFTYTLPDAEIVPIDGKIAGGTMVTISAKGWGPRSATLTSASELQSSFHRSNAVVASWIGGTYTNALSQV